MKRAIFLCLGLGALGCTDDKGGSPAETDDETPDPGDTQDPEEVPGGAMDVTAEVSEHIHTVVTVRWSTEDPTAGYVEYGETDAYGARAPLTAVGADHESLVLGLWADAEFHYRVVTIAEDGTEIPSADYTVTTGSLPADLPTLTATGDASWDGYMIAPIQGVGHVIVALDNQGRYVWYWVIESDENLLMRALLDPTGEGVLVCMAGRDDLGNKEDGYVLRISMDGSKQTEIPAPWIDHDMTLLPDGTIAGIVLQHLDEHNAPADSIQEIAEDGSMTQVFTAWDHLEWADSGALNGGGSWSHANALDYDAENDDYLMAMKELHTTARIDRASGEVIWALGGSGNQFAWGGDTEDLSMHHQFHAYEPGRLVVFENGEPSRGFSRVREFELDEENLVATEIWSYVREPSVYVFAKGDVERLENGNTLVVWSTSGEIQEVTPEKTAVWQLNTDLGNALTFISRVPSLYGDSAP